MDKLGFREAERLTVPAAGVPVVVHRAAVTDLRL